MKIDLTCPVELWQSAMPAEDVSECTFVLNNLSHKVVVSLLLTLSCYDQDNRLLFRQSERMQGLKVVPGERFSVMMVPNEWKNVKEAEVTIEKVWFRGWSGRDGLPGGAAAGVGLRLRTGQFAGFSPVLPLRTGPGCGFRQLQPGKCAAGDRRP